MMTTRKTLEATTITRISTGAPKKRRQLQGCIKNKDSYEDREPDTPNPGHCWLFLKGTTGGVGGGTPYGGWGNREPAHVRTKLNFDVKEEKDST